MHEDEVQYNDMCARSRLWYMESLRHNQVLNVVTSSSSIIRTCLISDCHNLIPYLAALVCSTSPEAGNVVAAHVRRADQIKPCRRREPRWTPLPGRRRCAGTASPAAHRVVVLGALRLVGVVVGGLRTLVGVNLLTLDAFLVAGVLAVRCAAVVAGQARETLVITVLRPDERLVHAGARRWRLPPEEEPGVEHHLHQRKEGGDAASHLHKQHTETVDTRSIHIGVTDETNYSNQT